MLQVRRKVYQRLRRPPLAPLEPPPESLGLPEDLDGIEGALLSELEALRLVERETRTALHRRDEEVDRLVREAEELRGRLEKKESKLAKMRETAGQARLQAFQARADMDNQRKRLARDREEMQRLAAEELVKELLGPLEHFRLALQSFEREADGRALQEGVTMVYRELNSALAAAGMTPIEPEAGAAFDPALHDAVSSSTDPAQPDGIVLNVLRPGFLLHSRVLRPALVEVNALPREQGSEGEKPTEAERKTPPAGENKRPSSKSVRRMTEPLEEARRMLDSRFDIEE